MKKLLALSAIVLGLSTPAFANTFDKSNPTYAEVHINGEVIDQTCVLDGTVADRRIELDKVKLSELKNGEAKLKDFTLKFKDCDFKSRQSVYVAFDHAHANVSTNGNLKNTSETNGNQNTATGVEIQITKANGDKINLSNADTAKSDAVSQRSLRATNGAVEFNFKAGYIAPTPANATTGLVTSYIPVTLQYQ